MQRGCTKGIDLSGNFRCVYEKQVGRHPVKCNLRHFKVLLSFRPFLR